MDVPCAYVNCLLLNNPTIRDVYAKDVYFFFNLHSKWRFCWDFTCPTVRAENYICAIQLIHSKLEKYLWSTRRHMQLLDKVHMEQKERNVINAMLSQMHRVHTCAGSCLYFCWPFLEGTAQKRAEEQVLEAGIFPYLGFQGQNRVPIRSYGETPRIFILSRFIYPRCSSTLCPEALPLIRSASL